jgi:hypothetical protein
MSSSTGIRTLGPPATMELGATGGATRPDAIAGLELEIGFGHFAHSPALGLSRRRSIL